MSLQILNSEWAPFHDTVAPGLDPINTWKTKLVYPFQKWVLAIVHKDIITANDNPIYTGDAPGKWTASAYSSALLFKRIAARWIPTAHIGILNSNTTLDRSLDMLPFEIIWRRYNVEGNSWMKRNPWNKYETGERYDEVIYEACLKWSVKTISGEIVHDPFLMLDENFEPQLRSDGMPRLMHSKNNTELEYTEVIHPNKGGEMSPEAVKAAITLFITHAANIRKMTEVVQETTLETYWEIGRLNADGKIEVWLDQSGKLTLWDELELDSLRNMSIRTAEMNDGTRSVLGDEWLIWIPLSEIISWWSDNVRRIVEAYHSGKQVYRDRMKMVDSNMAWMQWEYWTREDLDQIYMNVRRWMNNAMAQFTTDMIYVPVARALSERFSQEVWYRLTHIA